MRRRLLCLLGYVASVCPPLVSTLACFPILYRRGEGEVAVSLGALLLLSLALLPVWRRLRTLLKTPSAPLLWGLVFALFYLTHLVARQMLFISLSGLLGSLLGALFFRMAGVTRGGELK